VIEQDDRSSEEQGDVSLNRSSAAHPSAAPGLGPIPELDVEVTRTSASEPLAPERERELARAAVVAALVALRLVQASASQQSTPPRRRFAAPVRSLRRPVRGSWRHRL
jgi:hypothetical protein